VFKINVWLSKGKQLRIENYCFKRYLAILIYNLYIKNRAKLLKH